MASKYEKKLIKLSPTVDAMRNYVVTKPINFVKDVPYPRLTVLQNRIICFLISLVQPGDDEFNEIEFDSRTFIQIFQMHNNSNSNIKKSILGLRGNPVFTVIEPEVQGSIALTWCHVYIEEKTGIIRLRLDEDLGRYFLHINPKNGYIRYSISEIMKLKCKYSFWFYDQFKIGAAFGKRTLPIEYIRKQLNLPETYDAKYIKNKIINPVMDDINENTDLKVNYSIVKHGKRVVEYRFQYKYKVNNTYADDIEDMFKVSDDDNRHIEIINYLNKKTGNNFDVNNPYYISLIRRWLEEGCNVIDFQEVIDKKYNKWNNTPYSKYLNPDTLFGDKFYQYLYKESDWEEDQDYNDF